MCISFTEWIKYQMTSDHVPCKSSRAGGAPPHTDTDRTSRCPNPDSLKQRASVQLSLLNLWNRARTSLETDSSCFRNRALQRAPVRWTSPRNQPSEEVQDRAKAVTSQSNAWKPTCETSRVFPEQRMKPTCETKATACLNQQKASNKLKFYPD